MAKKRKSKKKSILYSTFYRVYFAVVLLCVIGIAFGARYLNGLLKDYESAQPEHVVETAARMFEDADYDTIYDYDTSAPELAGGDKDYYVENMHEIADGKQVSWSKAYSPDDDQKLYDVDLDGERFAQIALAPSGQTTKHGYRLWQLDSVTTYVTMGEQEPVEEPEEGIVEEEPEEVPAGIPCHITVPSDSAVTVDGAALTADDVATADIPTASAGLLPEGVPSPTLTEYLFYSESGNPQISVTDKNGNPQEVTSDGDYTWSCGLPEDPDLKAQFEKPVVEIAKKIAQCSAKTITKDGILRYCAKNSPASVNINNFDNSTGYSKKPEKFENISSSNYYRYSDNCFSCRVSFDYISKFTAEVVKTYPTTFTLYFIYQGDSGKLYNFTLY